MSNADQIKKCIEAAKSIVILQADNPDADSLGSALALEQILGDMGKQPQLYCAIDMPNYLKYLSGWDRVSNELPETFDASIIVDASTMSLLEKISGQTSRLAARPCIVLDHHEEVSRNITFATLTINDVDVSSTGELIYQLAKQLDWPLSVKTQEFLMTAILGDTQGLSNSLAKAQTYRVLADMVESGVDRPKLEEARRIAGKMPQAIYRYKARLIEHTEFYADNQLAIVTVPQQEISQFSPLYNPAPLIQSDMLQTEGIGVAIVLKHYDDGHSTASIRCNPAFPVAAKLAEHFGGGGHAYAAGFKIQDNRSFGEIKNETIRTATKLLDKIPESKAHETL